MACLFNIIGVQRKWTVISQADNGQKGVMGKGKKRRERKREGERGEGERRGRKEEKE